MAGPTYLFESVFGPDWQNLPPSLKKRYAVLADGSNEVTVEGKLDVKGSRVSRLLNPVLRLFGALVPYEGENIPVTVRFRAMNGELGFDRTFSFPGRPPYRFRSRIEPRKGGDTVEYMRFNLGWRGQYRFDGQKIRIMHRGYVLNIFGLLLPLPLSFIMGKGYGEEWAESDDSFGMMIALDHFLWGRTFGYHGFFRVLP